MSKLHLWEIDADVPSPMGKIYYFAKCRMCQRKVDIKYMDILPRERQRINIFHSIPLNQFDMTMALLNQSPKCSMITYMQLLYCSVSRRKL